jgi:hypothetical protein
MLAITAAAMPFMAADMWAISTLVLKGRMILAVEIRYRL